MSPLQRLSYLNGGVYIGTRVGNKTTHSSNPSTPSSSKLYPSLVEELSATDHMFGGNDYCAFRHTTTERSVLHASDVGLLSERYRLTYQVSSTQELSVYKIHRGGSFVLLPIRGCFLRFKL